MENVRNRINVRIETDKIKAEKAVAKPSYERSMRVRDGLVILLSKIPVLKLYKPVYIGFSVLELSKLVMYDFHYNKMLKWYPDAELCYAGDSNFLLRNRL